VVQRIPKMCQCVLFRNGRRIARAQCCGPSGGLCYDSAAGARSAAARYFDGSRPVALRKARKKLLRLAYPASHATLSVDSLAPAPRAVDHERLPVRQDDQRMRQQRNGRLPADEQPSHPTQVIVNARDIAGGDSQAPTGARQAFSEFDETDL
jgi:hypothetical protein